MVRFSIEKQTKTQTELATMVDKNKIRTITSTNQELAGESDYVQLEQGIFAYDYRRLFTLDGSLKTKKDPSVGKFAEFYKQAGRFAQKGDDFLLRGSNFIVSVDPTLVVSQKLNILEKDFVDSLDILTKTTFENGQETRQHHRFASRYSGRITC